MAASFNKARRGAQRFFDWKVNGRAHEPIAAAARPWSDATGIPAPRITRSIPLTAKTLSQVLRFLRRVAFVLVLGAGAAVADDQRPLDLEATSNRLTAVEDALKETSLTDTDLQRLRAENDPLGPDLQAAIADLTPRLAASAKRLAELTPKTKDNNAAPAPETNAAAAELASEKQKHDALDANLRTARALLLKVDDNAIRIGAKRRELFARETFAQSSSVFSPQLWLNVWSEVPHVAAVMTATVGEWFAGLPGRLTPVHAAVAAIIVALIGLLAMPAHRVARRVIFRTPEAGSPSRLRRAIAAAWTLIVLAALPLLALWAVSVELILLDQAGPRARGVLEAVLDGARLLIVGNALGRAMLAPNAPSWRLVPANDRTARLLFRNGMMVAAIWAVERLVEPAADAGSSLNIVVAGRALGVVLVVVAVAHTLRRLAPSRHPQDTATAAQADPWAPARTLGWIAALAAFAAAAAGYIAFATFLINQSVVLIIIGCVLYLIDVIIHDGTEAVLDPEAAVGAGLKAMVGLKRNVLGQIAVVVQGVARVVIVVIAAAAVLEPWGVQSQDWFVSLRAAYFGFGVGGVTLSLSSMLAAALAFLIALFVTRLIQTWLTDRLLPQTGLDAGVSNSISTIFGYVGATVAVLIGAAQIGLDLQKIAIVAGALSVGIGFGLQSIANNFVSGLILLWERGVRVGDWVMVGTDQGFVRRINARATEIETFDRATVIVPNSNLVSGVVKNWVNPDRVGRILIAVNVDYDSDVEKVREILIDAARSHDLVLKIPAPSVAFADFGEWAFKFNLICFVDDVETAGRTQSELNFDILRRLREANLRIPAPPVTPFRPAAQ
jgi:small-conductance mechanosensitive channel